MKIVEKPWGRELWVAHSDRYALKIIEVNKGTRSSLQYHVKKHEHIYVDRRDIEDKIAAAVNQASRAGARAPVETFVSE